MDVQNLTYPEPVSRPRSALGTGSTLIAAMLLLAILPSAVAITCPHSAAILEDSLADARIVHVQRVRPDLDRDASASSSKQRARSNDQRALARIVGLSAMRSLPVPACSRACGETAPSVSADHGDGSLLAVRAGRGAIPPPSIA